MNIKKREFNSEEFLDRIATFPSWIVTPDDLMKFCRHIQYRMYQWKATVDFIHANVQMPQSFVEAMEEMQLAYDDAYICDKLSLKTFSEMKEDHEASSIRCKKKWEDAGIKEKK